MKNIIFLFILLSLSCVNQSSESNQDNEERLKFFLGFWQNLNKPHNFICFSYAIQDIDSGKCAWGTFPLELAADNPELIDTANYYRSISFLGGLKLEKDRISCWYEDLENHSVRIEGEIKIRSKNTIVTPVGTFRKLSKQEVTKINPNL